MIGTEQGTIIVANKKLKKPVEINTRLGLEHRHLGPVYSITRNLQFSKVFMSVGDWCAKIWMDDLRTPLVKTLARLIDVPLVIADATCLTQAGYVGEDVESILFKVRKIRLDTTKCSCRYFPLMSFVCLQLYLESGQDIERCQRGIVYIDETDKIRKSGGNVSISRDVSGEGKA